MTRASDRHLTEGELGASSDATTRDAGASASASAGVKRRRLPGSVLAAARPPPVKTARGKGKGKTTKKEDAEANAPRDERPRSSLFDVVSDSEGDDDGVGVPAARPTTTVGASATGARTLTSSAYACVRRVTDEALLEEARRLCGSDARASALATTPEPASVPREPLVESPAARAMPSPTPPTRETRSKTPPRAAAAAAAPLETFDDMFSMFVGGGPAPAPATTSEAPLKPPSAPVPRASPPPAPPPSSTTTTTTTAKPKLSFAQLMASADDDGDDSDD